MTGLLALLGVFQLAIPACSVMCAQVPKARDGTRWALLEVVFGILLAWFGAGEKRAPRPVVARWSHLVRWFSK